jgi:hypothetical protein
VCEVTHPVVSLNTAEQKLAAYVARTRSDFYFEQERHRITLYGAIGQDGLTDEERFRENMLQSMGAEVAFCKAMNVFPRLEVEDRSCFDAVLPGGHKVDIKSTKHLTGPMHVKPRKHLKTHPEWYALMVGTMPLYTLIGFIEAAYVLREETMDYTRDKPCHVIKQQLLRPWDVCLAGMEACAST